MARPIRHQFVVLSESSNHEYVVTQYDAPPFDNEGHPEWACGCRGWTSHVSRRDCKHITFAQSGGALTAEQAIVKKLLGAKLE
jgi:hypothetical protein